MGHLLFWASGTETKRCEKAFSISNATAFISRDVRHIFNKPLLPYAGCLIFRLHCSKRLCIIIRLTPTTLVFLRQQKLISWISLYFFLNYKCESSSKMDMINWKHSDLTCITTTWNESIYFRLINGCTILLMLLTQESPLLVCLI